MPSTVSGTVIKISDDGDLLTDITPDKLTTCPKDENVRIVVDEEHETFGLFPSNHEQPSMTLIGILDEGSPLRLHLVGDSASMMLGVRAGAPVQVKW